MNANSPQEIKILLPFLKKERGKEKERDREKEQKKGDAVVEKKKILKEQKKLVET